jgi:hypothetical protein
VTTFKEFWTTCPLVGKAGYIVTTMAVLSIFFYAAFDLTWWVDAPFRSRSGRAVVLFLFHVAALVLGVLGIAFGESERK